MKNRKKQIGKGICVAIVPMLLFGACGRAGSLSGTEAMKEKERAETTEQEESMEDIVRLEEEADETAQSEERERLEPAAGSDESSVTEGQEEYRGFLLDNVLHSTEHGDIHYNLYVPDGYDGSEPYALFLTLPGYEGLYFQGVGTNLRSEEFGFTAQSYNPKMIIVAPQLEDWNETSADQTIALTEYFLSHYNIDASKVYANGYSGGGETMSIVMGKRPDLFTAYLQCSSQWDGDYEAVVESRTPVYIVVGESDEYYGSEPSERAYEELYQRYQDEGLSDSEIQELLVLDVKDAEYFESQGVNNQHGGGNLFANDEEIMGWLFQW